MASSDMQWTLSMEHEQDRVKGSALGMLCHKHVDRAKGDVTGDAETSWPFRSSLQDNLGNLIPCEPLRNKYSVERFDVFPEGEEGGKEGDGGDGDGDSE